MRTSKTTHPDRARVASRTTLMEPGTLLKTGTVLLALTAFGRG